MFKRKAFVTPFAKKPRVEARESASESGGLLDIDIDLGDGEKAKQDETKASVLRPNLKGRKRPAVVEAAPQPAVGQAGVGGDVVYEVNFAKNSSKKHKNWEPGTMVCAERTLTLHDETDKVIGKSFKSLKEWEMGDELECGAFLVEVGAKQTSSIPNACPSAPAPSIVKRLPVSLKRPLHGGKKAAVQPEMTPDTLPEGTLILKESNGKVLAHLPAVPLGRHLRPHQREGVKFLYDVTSRPSGYRGVILADEMGLGKTLQCISLIQAHVKNKHSSVKKVVIVVPSSLVGSWGREFKKWLGNNPRAQPTLLAAADKKDYTSGKIKTFNLNSMCNVLILSYEMCRSYSSALSNVSCDLLLCDEGHRLKGFNTQISTVLQKIPTTRRVLITGTPVQNNLAEFYSLLDFVNPGLLGDKKGYLKEYASHITKMAEAGCSKEQQVTGNTMQSKLKDLTEQYILRRTSADISSHLPPKSEVLLFFKPSLLQEHLYKHILSLTGSLLDPLQSITALKQVLTHPSLILGEQAINSDLREACQKAANGISSKDNVGKIPLLKHLLDSFKSQGHKCVVVSSSVKVLDMIASSLSGLRSERLDGKVPSAKRMAIVDSFNSSRDIDVMLLSCKAGGVGLNLVGASRLVLVDMDWNPANDLQAVARIWREGQTRPCKIYRLVCRGTLEERILQRQLLKMKLSSNMLVDKTAVHNPSKWSPDEIRKLFEYNGELPCLTFTAEGYDLQQELEEANEEHLPKSVTYIKELDSLERTDDTSSLGDSSVPSSPCSSPSTALSCDDASSEDECF